MKIGECYVSFNVVDKKFNRKNVGNFPDKVLQVCRVGLGSLLYLLSHCTGSTRGPNRLLHFPYSILDNFSELSFSHLKTIL